MSVVTYTETSVFGICESRTPMVFSIREQRRPMKQTVLKPHDLVVALKLCLDRTATFGTAARDLHLSASEVHGAVARGVRAGFLQAAEERAPLRAHRPILAALQEFLDHGVKYAFPAVLGSITRGVATAHAASPLSERISDPSGDPPPVWPDPTGKVRGMALCPLYPGAPAAAASDERLRQLLVLIDALRVGRARERELARELIPGILASRGQPS